MRPNDPVPPEFGYLLARDSMFRGKAIRSMTGSSGRQRAQVSAVSEFRLSVPAHDAVWHEFSLAVSPYFTAIKANAEAIDILAQLRDTLLPKIIVGQLRVPGPEGLFGECNR